MDLVSWLGIICHEQHSYYDVLPGDATNNLWVLDLILGLLNIRQAELQLITTLSILLQTHCVDSSQADSLFSSVTVVPIRCLVCALVPRLLFTVTAFPSHLELRENYVAAKYYQSRVVQPPHRPHRKLRLYC
jgi:hypothetical protein